MSWVLLSSNSYCTKNIEDFCQKLMFMNWLVMSLVVISSSVFEIQKNVEFSGKTSCFWIGQSHSSSDII